MFDVIVIGGGVVGGLIFRELTKYELSVCLVEKEKDVAMGASKANSGIVHAGFDALPNTLKAKFNVAGNKMMESLTKELGVEYRRNGSLVLAFSEEEIQTLFELKERGEENGVVGLQILEREKLRAKEPNVAQDALAALYAPTGGIVCPYGLTIAAIGNGMDNGGKLFTDFEVEKIQKIDGGFHLFSKNGLIEGKTVVNCAGLQGGRIASLIGDELPIKGRKGEYILLDRESGNFISHTLFCTPTKQGKGILVTPTADGNLLLGPTAEETENPNTETSATGLRYVIEKAKKMSQNPPLSNTITSFAGVRAYSEKHDFIVEESKKAQGFIHCIGIESPGLTASPAIAKYVVEILLSKRIALKPNGNFNGKRKPSHFFKHLSIEEKNKLIQIDPAYGKIVCRCEQITEGEILRAIRENPPAQDVDGVKRRTRSGMGRCQGGFCQPYVVELLAKEQGVAVTEITKNGKGSTLLVERTK
ncbi:MAG: NAD(P)/FAD-dependent oxidoreductase [Clostridia bacterium]|nr:NAD(P)/FAD-dependent oxidoreductase [Clostridia bacterium]